jgi:hypothetical protein
MLELGLSQTWLTNSQIGSGWLQNVASELISPRTQINSEEADEAAHDFTASIALAYRLLIREIDLLGLESLLKHKWRLRKLWQVTWDPAYKTEVNLVTKTVR